MSTFPARWARRVTVALLLVATVVALLTVALAYSLTVEYGDTADPMWVSAADTLRMLGPEVLAAVALAGAALATDPGSRRVRVATLGLVAVTAVGTALAGVAGVEVKDRRCGTTSCAVMHPTDRVATAGLG